MTCRKDDTRFS